MAANPYFLCENKKKNCYSIFLLDTLLYFLLDTLLYFYI